MQVFNQERIYDYFTIIGIQSASELINNESSVNEDISYKLKVLDRYPKTDDPNYLFPEEIPAFCLDQEEYKEDQYVEPKIYQFILTSQTGSRYYCSCLMFREEKTRLNIPKTQQIQDNANPPSQKQITLTTYFQPKAFCLISHLNYSAQTREILKELYQYLNSFNKQPIEKLILNIVEGLTLPEYKVEGDIIQMTVLNGTTDIYFLRCEKFPYCQYEAISCLFTLLDKENIIKLFLCLLLEKKIHLISKSLAVRALIVEALQTLIFPYEYCHMLTPILPEEFFPYKEAPVPFIIGYNVFDRDKFEIKNDEVYVFLEENQVILKDQIPYPPDKFLRILFYLPQCPVSREKSKQYLEKLDQAFPLPELDLIEESQQILDIWEIRNLFLKFQSKLIKDYDLYFEKDKHEHDHIHKSKSLNQLNKVFFNAKQFFQHHKNQYIYELTQTTIFQYFVQQRLVSKNEKKFQFFQKYYNLINTHKNRFCEGKEHFSKIKYKLYEGTIQSCEDLDTKIKSPISKEFIVSKNIRLFD